MASPVRLDRDQIQLIRSLNAHGPEVFDIVLGRLKSIPAAPMLLPKFFAKLVEGVASDKLGPVQQIAQQVIVLYGWIRHGATVEDVIRGVDEAIRTETDNKPVYLDEWSKVQNYYSEFLRIPVVRLVASVFDLAFEYANLLRNSRILTDVRPIFSEDGKKIQGALVSHTLRLRYDSIEGSHELHLAMDESDIMDLAEQCGRARDKAVTARSLMWDKAQIPTVALGEVDDA